MLAITPAKINILRVTLSRLDSTYHAIPPKNAKYIPTIKPTRAQKANIPDVSLKFNGIPSMKRVKR